MSGALDAFDVHSDFSKEAAGRATGDHAYEIDADDLVFPAASARLLHDFREAFLRLHKPDGALVNSQSKKREELQEVAPDAHHEGDHQEEDETTGFLVHKPEP